jgi:hypothetical protein
MRFKLRTDRDVLACMARSHATLNEAKTSAQWQVREGEVESALVLDMRADGWPTGRPVYGIWRSSHNDINESNYLGES